MSTSVAELGLKVLQSETQSCYWMLRKYSLVTSSSAHYLTTVSILVFLHSSGSRGRARGICTYLRNFHYQDWYLQVGGREEGTIVEVYIPGHKYHPSGVPCSRAGAPLYAASHSAARGLRGMSQGEKRRGWSRQSDGVGAENTNVWQGKVKDAGLLSCRTLVATDENDEQEKKVYCVALSLWL